MRDSSLVRQNTHKHTHLLSIYRKNNIINQLGPCTANHFPRKISTLTKARNPVCVVCDFWRKVLLLLRHFVAVVTNLTKWLAVLHYYTLMEKKKAQLHFALLFSKKMKMIESFVTWSMPFLLLLLLFEQPRRRRRTLCPCRK